MATASSGAKSGGTKAKTAKTASAKPRAKKPASKAAADTPKPAAETGPPLLEVRDLHVFYDKIHALRGITVSLAKDSIVSLIGANGAGKSTMLKAISGVIAASEGDVVFNGESINDLSAHEVVRRGVIQVPEGRRIFGRLSVQDNLKIGAFLNDDKKWIAEAEDRCLQMFPVLKERLHQTAGTLSGGEQQMLAIARGLMSNPRVLLLDEPSMGLAPMLVQRIFDTVVEIRKQGVSVLLVEQNAFLALQIADYGYVMETGAIALEGPAQEVLDNPEVKKAYLG
jgi:branched-chain amino acid transport system ATP-binding protein